MRNLKYGITVFAGLWLALHFFGCGKPTGITGDGSQTGNALVGKLYASGGTAPAKDVKVTIRPQKSLADTAGTGFGKRMADTASVVTDSAGRFAFDSTLDTGTYVIEAASGNDAVLIDSVAVKTKAATDSLAPDTLKPAGALKGIIKLSEGGDPRKVFVLAFGIDRFARVNADGSFKFSGLAEARYDLRLISSLDNYGVLDTPNVAVTAAETTDVKTIELPFTGIPTPKNVTISYDTLKKIVTLTWSKADTALVKSFNVYRRNVDSNTVAVRINASPVADTVFKDSTGVQDQTYEYRVAAVNKSVTEGTQSAAVSVTDVSAFKFRKNFGQPGTGTGQFLSPADIAIDAGGNYWIADGNRNKILKFDSTGSFLREWGVAGTDSGKLNNPYGLDIDPIGNIVVCEWDGSRIEKFDTLGNLILEIDSAGIQIKDVSTDKNGNIYFSMAASGVPNSIVKYNSQGIFLISWQLSSTFLSHGLLVRNGRVYCAGSRPSLVGHPYDDVLIEVFDTVGTHLGIIDVRQSGETGVIDIRDLEADGSGRIYAVDPESGLVRIFNTDFTFLTSFGVKGSGVDQFSWIQGIAISTNGRIAITDRSSIHLLFHP